MLARAKAAGLRTAAICNWFPLITELIAEEKSADLEKLAPADPWVTDETVSALAGDYDLLFVHLDEVDHTGHMSGFSTDNPEYIAAIERKDAQVGTILAALRARPSYARESWLIVVPTDHGGAGLDHGALDADNRTIPLIFDGPVKKGMLPDGVSHTDVTPTVLAWLGLPPASVFDGKVIALK
jgi:predicted AlkP superfamily pyrophosphatase or phosphodiesterase